MLKTDFLYLTPLMIIAGAPLVIMLVTSVYRNLKVTFGISVFMFTAAFLSIWLVPEGAHHVGDLLIIDNFSMYFLGIFYLASIVITFISYDYLSLKPDDREEYFIILFIAALGASILVMSDHFISFFLGLETLSISLYVLIAYLKYRDYSIEAGVKFLVISSLSTAFLLFGMGLIYAGTGSMNFESLVNTNDRHTEWSIILLAGTGLIMAGLGFKLALVPFHMWTPDIYQGAPVPVAAFIATISKGAVMALALRFFVLTEGFTNESLFFVISSIAILSMFTGNLLALNQMKLKRILAYSSIANLGYLLIVLLTGSNAGTDAAVFYIIVYIISTLGAFGTISILSERDQDIDNIEDIRGLFQTNPLITMVFSVSLLSLAGLPLTAGFMSKFFLVLAGVKSGLWLLAFMLIINSVISLYYYLRIIKTMFIADELRKKAVIKPYLNVILVVILLGILFLGIFPSFLIESF